MTRSSNQNNSSELLPLTPAVLHILLVLAIEPKHGYAIMKEVEAITSSQITLGPGTLYGAIKRLLDARLIEELDELPAPELDDERRRYYRLTPFGRQVLRAELDRLSRLVVFARSQQLLGDAA